MILDQLFLKSLELYAKYDIFGIILLVGFAQIFGFPTELSLPLAGMVFGNNLKTIIVGGISDLIASILILEAGKNLKLFIKREMKLLSIKEVTYMRILPIVRGAILPTLIDFKRKDIYPVLAVTSFIWSIILINIGSFFDPTIVAKTVKDYEPIILTLLIIFLGYKFHKKLRGFKQTP